MQYRDYLWYRRLAFALKELRDTENGILDIAAVGRTAEAAGSWHLSMIRPAESFMIDVPDDEYIVFEHGSFDFEKENRSVEEKMEAAK